MAKQGTKSETLGERIQKMRKRQKIDLDAFSEKTGFTPDHLQDIEEGKISPPVGALIRISRALAIDSAELLADGTKKERRRSYRKRTKAYAYKNLTPGAEDKHLWAYLVTIEPKKKHEKVQYKHEGEEFVYVLEGRIEVQVGDNVRVLKKGASTHFDSAINHSLKNLSTKEAKLLVVVYTP